MNMQAMLEQIQAIVGIKCSFIDLFSPQFIERCTDFINLEDLKRELPFDMSDLGIVDEEKLSYFVKRHTIFTSWMQFITEATIFYKK